jgi:hypothetical protein
MRHKAGEGWVAFNKNSMKHKHIYSLQTGFCKCGKQFEVKQNTNKELNEYLDTVPIKLEDGEYGDVGWLSYFKKMNKTKKEWEKKYHEWLVARPFREPPTLPETVDFFISLSEHAIQKSYDKGFNEGFNHAVKDYAMDKTNK